MKQDKVLSLLGLARRAGQTRSGEFQVEESVKSRKAKLVILASDASDNTVHKFENLCKRCRIKLVRYGTKEQLGHALGQEYRVIVCMLGDGLADAVQQQLNG